MKTLPLFYYPSKWLWVDDDPILLNTMTHVFGEKNQVEPFQSSQVCLNFLKNYKSPLSQESFLKSSKGDESYGILQHTPVDFDITMIAGLANNPKRHEEITVMIIDYNMPELDGFSLAKAIQSLPIQKILLTGKAQESQAIEAFNHNLIHRFIQKGELEMVNKLSTYLEELSLCYFQKLTWPLLSYLETEAPLPLSDPIFIDFFEDYCEKNKVKEYYLIDKQGSLLCIDEDGNRSCLIIQSDRSIQSWLTLYSNEKYLSDGELAKIQSKEKILFFEPGKEAWQVDPSEWPKHFHTPSILEGRERYFWSQLIL